MNKDHKYGKMLADSVWERLHNAMFTLVAEHGLKLSGYHADTPITIKAEPSIWPTAAFINIHEHPL